MSRPLLITDCDEVLLHMVGHFSAWLDEAHDIDLPLHGEEGDVTLSMTHRAEDRRLEREETWPLFDGFFRTEMARQTLIPGAREALARLAAQADVVILTNLGDHYHGGRVEQLRAHGIEYRVRCNQGGKGAPVAELVAEYGPTSAVFVDDLHVHHDSVARGAPEVWRLHMVGEPRIAARIPAAAHAHVRIDDWARAVDWIEARFAEGFAPTKTGVTA